MPQLNIWIKEGLKQEIKTRALGMPVSRWVSNLVTKTMTEDDKPKPVLKVQCFYCHREEEENLMDVTKLMDHCNRRHGKQTAAYILVDELEA